MDATAGDLSVEEAARRLGLHYMTVYRYIRLGRLPAEHRGGRWHIRPADLEALHPPAGARPGTQGRLLDRLLAGDSPGSWSIVEDALVAATPTRVYTEVLAPTLRSLGESWAAGRLTVAEEHRATALAMGIVGRLSPLFRRRGRHRPGPVVLAGVEGDSHAIPLMMVADVLSAGGFEVIHLGADVPVDTLVQFAAATRDLRAVGLSASTDAAAERAARAVAALHARLGPVPVVVGGPAVTSAEAARRLGADGWAADATTAVDVFSSVTAAR